jgi:hypothetical protein
MKTRTALALTGLLLTATLALAQVPGNSVRIEGPITAIDPALLQIVVTDVTVQVTGDTIIKEYGRVIGFDKLTLGSTVAVCGLLDGDVLVANRITVRPCVAPVTLAASSGLLAAPLARGTRIEGVITAIDADLLQLVVAEVLVQVTDTTLIRERGRIIPFDALEIGATVAACGTFVDDVLIAQHVTVRPCASVALTVSGGAGQTAVRGTGSVRIEAIITAIDAELLQLVVGDTTVQVTASTLIWRQGQTISFGDLQVGMTVAVCGFMDGDILVAKRVTVRPSVS